MDQSLKYLSFSSPKGGVGRTLTLCNCAMIYANGCDWAGIDKSTVILADLDFNAPGIHYYDFFGHSAEAENSYHTYHLPGVSRDALLRYMEQQPIGLLFLLTAIMNNAAYQQKTAAIAEALRQAEQPPADLYEALNSFLLELLQEEAYSPLGHLIEVTNGSSAVFILPAASPTHRDFSGHVYRFDWLQFVHHHFGLLVLDCIVFTVAQHINSRLPQARPVRVLVDQQAGMSVPSALNRSLSDAGIFVSGMNRQNKTGLESLVNHYQLTYQKEPWIVLNQYNFRKLALQYRFDQHDRTPHEVFQATDERERKAFIRHLCRHQPGLDKKIFVTEFIQDAIQQEHFYDTRGLAVKELTQLLVRIEQSFLPPPAPPTPAPAPATIVFAGERIWLENRYSGPFEGIYSLLQRFFPKACIVGIAMKHEDIVRLASAGQLPGRLTNREKPDKAFTPEKLPAGIYDFDFEADSDTQLSIGQLDLISYPYYARTGLLEQERIQLYDPTAFTQPQAVADSLTGTSLRYYRENILRWQEYAEQEGGLIQGVPLFVNFQLLAYRKDFIMDDQHFQYRYRKHIHRNFEGFQAPQDIRDFACLTNHDAVPNNHVLLCSNDENIAMWYEWQTIFSMFYDGMGKSPYHTALEDYRAFLLTDEALDATLIYLELLQQVKLTAEDGADPSGHPVYDWDKLIQDFYFNKKSGLILVWPDSIPRRKQEGATQGRRVIYQVPPSFHLFEECWLLSAVRKTEPAATQAAKASFLNYFLTPAAQEHYTHSGGLPVHKSVLSSLDLWSLYPFIPPIWSVYYDVAADRILNKRESFAGNYLAGKAIARALKAAYHTEGLDKPQLKQLLEQEFDAITQP